MSRIKSKDTTPERIVRSFLHRNGFRFRLNVKDLPGKPGSNDKQVFYFWSKGTCKKIIICTKKFAENVARDQRTEHKLKAHGWNVIVVWQCEVEKNVFQENLANKIISGDSNA